MVEDGGQVLRCALIQFLLTNQAFAIDRIRAGREKPGLMTQHLLTNAAVIQAILPVHITIDGAVGQPAGVIIIAS